MIVVDYEEYGIAPVVVGAIATVAASGITSGAGMVGSSKALKAQKSMQKKNFLYQTILQDKQIKHEQKVLDMQLKEAKRMRAHEIVKLDKVFDENEKQREAIAWSQHEDRYDTLRSSKFGKQDQRDAIIAQLVNVTADINDLSREIGLGSKQLAKDQAIARMDAGLGVFGWKAAIPIVVGFGAVFLATMHKKK